MTCAKRRVACVIIDGVGNILGTGTNGCANPQPVCPREPGEGYEKCESVCKQAGHAEIMAVEDALIRGNDLNYAKAHVFGHDHVCEGCIEVLRSLGLATIQVHVPPPPPRGELN